MSSSDIEVLVVVRVADEALNQIAAVDSRIHVVDNRGWFDVEYIVLRLMCEPGEQTPELISEYSRHLVSSSFVDGQYDKHRQQYAICATSFDLGSGIDHLIVVDEAQLRRVLKKYASYYNQVRTHLSLGERIR